MTDLNVFTSALSCISTATEIAKIIKDGAAGLEKAEYKMKMAELLEALADTKVKMVEIKEALAAKDEKIKELEKAFEIKEEILKYRDAVYLKNSANKPTGEPFCLCCWQQQRKLSHLATEPKDRLIQFCSSCKTKFPKYMTPDIGIDGPEDYEKQKA